MENLRLFEIKYVGATDTKPTRIRIKDLRLKQTSFISYHKWNTNDQLTHVEDIAKGFLESLRIPVLYCMEGDSVMYLATDNFRQEIK